MNKYKKIAAAVVSTVMAGTMVLSLSACGPTDEGGNGSGTGNAALDRLLNHMLVDSNAQGRLTVNADGWNTAKSYWEYLSDQASNTALTALPDEWDVVDSSGNVNYSAYNGNTGTSLSLAIGYSGEATGAFFGNLGDAITLPDGKQYSSNTLKPAWVQLSTDLHITFTDQYKGWQTSQNLTNFINGTDSTDYANVDLFTTDLDVAVSRAAATPGSVLNLADYLDKMPHFQKYLLDNPVVYLSLLQYGMSTENGENQVLYVAPYFDGSNAIERYCIIRKDWADKLLNGTSALSEAGAKYSEACAAETHVTSYMGSTNYDIECAADETSSNKVTITKDYSKALTAAKSETTALGAAYKEIAGAAYAGESGNIVDIMNSALAANKDATGSQLVALYRAYIDVCYLEDGAPHYTAETRSDVFNGADACWDVDDLVAILRCVKTNAKTLTGKDNGAVGIVPRSGQNDRTPDMVRLAAQLYGVRGADSRYEYTYITKDGTLKDASCDAEFYEALANFHLLREEGLIEDYSGYSAFTFATAASADQDAFMMYDYSQTQTLNGFYAEDSSLTGVTVAGGYNFAPIVTPVAKWDVDGDGNHTDLMRFTESWRSVKTSGLALNGDLAKAGNEAKLKAALQLVDYLFSNDGQIVSTYGPMATASGSGGFWYNQKDNTATSGYFTYKGDKYLSDTKYEGKLTPTVTQNLIDSFKGKSVNGFAVTSNNALKEARLNFTNYARMIIGSTLPVGIKDQSFENQLTSEHGKAGAAIVGHCLEIGVIKGMTLDINSSNYWYTCVPTGLPIASNFVTFLASTAQQHLRYITGTQMTGGSKNFYSIFNHIILFGLNGTYNQQNETYTF